MGIDKGSDLEGIIKNQNEVEVKKGVDFSKTSIIEWIDKSVKEPLFTQKRNIVLVENGKSLVKKINDDEYIVPTYGTYTKFIIGEINDDEEF